MKEISSRCQEWRRRIAVCALPLLFASGLVTPLQASSPSTGEGNHTVCVYDGGSPTPAADCPPGHAKQGKCTPNCITRSSGHLHGDLKNAAKDATNPTEEVSAARVNHNTVGLTPIEPRFGECRFINNASTNDYFVPFNNANEWSQFIRAAEGGTISDLSVHKCARPFSPGANPAIAIAHGLTYGGDHLDVDLSIPGAFERAKGNLNTFLGDQKDSSYPLVYTGKTLPYSPEYTLPYWNIASPEDVNHTSNWPKQDPQQAYQRPSWIDPITTTFTHSCYETKVLTNVCRSGSYKSANCPYTREECDGGWAQTPISCSTDKDGKETCTGGAWYCTKWGTHTYYHGVCNWSCDVVGSVCVNDKTETRITPDQKTDSDGYTWSAGKTVSMDPERHEWREDWDLTIYTRFNSETDPAGNWRGKTKAVCANPRPEVCNIRGKDDTVNCQLYVESIAVAPPRGAATEAGLPICSVAPPPPACTGVPYCANGREYDACGQDVGDCGDRTDGECGSANGVATSRAPDTNLCSAGSASAVAGTGPWTWTCIGINGGSDAPCSAPVEPQTNCCYWGCQ